MNKHRLFLKILAPILTFCMLSATSSASFDNCLSIMRDIEDNSVFGTLYVGEGGLYTPVTVKVTNEDSDIIHLEQVYAGDDGYAVFEYIHDIQNAGTGTMTVTAYHNSTIDTATYKVVDANVINSLVSTIQTECKKESPDYVIVKNAYLGEDSDANGIADNAEIFNLNLTLYNTLPNQDNVFKILADDPENDSVDSMEKAVQAFYDAVAIETIINGSSTSVITDLMSNDLYSPIFKKDKLPVDSEGKCVLDVVSGTVQTKVYEQILYDNITSKQVLADKLALYILTKSLEFGAWQKISEVLSAYDASNYLDIDYSVYNTLNNKSVVDKAMSTKFDSFVGIAEAFEAAADAQKQKEQSLTTTPRPGGSGGGGGGGGGFSVSISKDYNKENDNVNSENANTNENIAISASSVFEDMNEAKWAIEAVEALHKKGIIDGTGEMRFEPNRGITRAEFTKIIVGMAGLSPISKDVFADISPQHWSSPYAAAAYKAGIVVGDDNKNFNGSKIINREEMAVMVQRLMNKLDISPKESETADFDDSDAISYWASEAVNYLKRIEVINGRSKNFFEPKTTLTRAEAAVVIYKVLNKA